MSSGISETSNACARAFLPYAEHIFRQASCWSALKPKTSNCAPQHPNLIARHSAFGQKVECYRPHNSKHYPFKSSPPERAKQTYQYNSYFGLWGIYIVNFVCQWTNVSEIKLYHRARSIRMMCASISIDGLLTTGIARDNRPRSKFALCCTFFNSRVLRTARGRMNMRQHHPFSFRFRKYAP
jgi:hypothetical protein